MDKPDSPARGSRRFPLTRELLAKAPATHVHAVLVSMAADLMHLEGRVDHPPTDEELTAYLREALEEYT